MPSNYMGQCQNLQSENIQTFQKITLRINFIKFKNFLNLKKKKEIFQM